ncbi:MAG: hypothetical protein JO041_08470, partial [Acidobacteria bacterium]|nr:hypothetical protein [Acidobacteriota bacterium]
MFSFSPTTLLRFRVSAGLASLTGFAVLAGCGSSYTAPTPTTVKDRVFISNQLISSGLPSGEINIVSGQNDQSQTFISTGGAPGAMLLSPDKKHTLVLDSSTRNAYSIDNTLGGVAGNTVFADVPSSVVAWSDNATAYAAIRNAGTISVFDYASTYTVKNNIAVPTVRTLVMSHNGNVLLAFSDDSNSVTFIDTSKDSNGNPKNVVQPAITGFDRPVYGVFTNDDSKAFILNCGFECGGTAASVTVLDIATMTPGASVSLPGATFGLLDPSGNTLYVAGSC